MTLYLGDTITIKATITDPLGAPLVPDSQEITFYDANGKVVGSYDSPTPQDTNIFLQSHQSKKYDTPTHTEIVNGTPVTKNWLCHWTIVKDGDTDSEDIPITVNEI